MKQGEIWYANLTPTKGTEQSGHRPVVIISGDMLNMNLPLVIACPLTTKIKKYKGNVILNPTKVNGLELQSEILTFHIRSMAKELLLKKGWRDFKKRASRGQGNDWRSIEILILNETMLTFNTSCS